MNHGDGGPFGAAILDKEGTILAIASNSVLKDHDPTAHAEVNAIRMAAKVLGTHDLSDCVLYTTCYPCPMCLGAIIWSNIKVVHFGCQKEDAEAIGFRDDFIYRFIQNKMIDSSILQLTQTDREACLKLFEDYSKTNKPLY